MRAPGKSSLAVGALVCASFALLGLAWLMAMPPGSNFDEKAHYVKAIGAGALDLYGEPHEVSAAERRAFRELGRRQLGPGAEAQALGRAVRPSEISWQARTTRQFEVPRELFASQLGCTIAGLEVTGDCLEQPASPSRRAEIGTYAGTYQPFVYVPIGLAARAASGPLTGVRLGRAATLAISLALLLAAVWLLWDPRSPGTSLLGMAGAATPMVLFVSSALSPSGPEVAAAVCFAAALIRLVRDERPPHWDWIAAGVAGAVLALSRPLGPAFALLLLASVALLAGPQRVRAALRAGRGPAVGAGLALLAAGALGAWWEFTYQPHPETSATSLLDAIGPSLENLPSLFRHAVGVFGALDAELPATAYALWAALLLLVLAAAVDVGGRRERLSLAALVLGTVLVVLVMSLVFREIGPLQGRYVLPILVLVPLWAGELVHRGRDRLARPVLRRLLAGAFGLAAVVHLGAVYAAGRRFSVGHSGSWLYPFDPGWAPPLGWAPWLMLAVAGAGCLLAAGLVAGRYGRKAAG